MHHNRQIKKYYANQILKNSMPHKFAAHPKEVRIEDK